MRRMLITASAPHSAETPGPSQCRTVSTHHVKAGHEPIQGPIWPFAMARNRLGLPDASLQKRSSRNAQACLEAALWELGEQPLRHRRALYHLAPQHFDTPSPALSGLGRPDKIPKAPSKAPSARASTSTARQRRVESPRIASFDHFTVCFTSAAARTGPAQGQGLHPPPASLGRAMPTPNWRAGQRSHLNNMLTIFCDSTVANDRRV